MGILLSSVHHALALKWFRGAARRLDVGKQKMEWNQVDSQ